METMTVRDLVAWAMVNWIAVAISFGYIYGLFRARSMIKRARIDPKYARNFNESLENGPTVEFCAAGVFLFAPITTPFCLVGDVLVVGYKSLVWLLTFGLPEKK